MLFPWLHLSYWVLSKQLNGLDVPVDHISLWQMMESDSLGGIHLETDAQRHCSNAYSMYHSVDHVLPWNWAFCALMSLSTDGAAFVLALPHVVPHGFSIVWVWNETKWQSALKVHLVWIVTYELPRMIWICALCPSHAPSFKRTLNVCKLEHTVIVWVWVWMLWLYHNNNVPNQWQ